MTDRHSGYVGRRLSFGHAPFTRIVIAHEDALVAEGVARRLERRWSVEVVTCTCTTELRQALDPRSSDMVLVSDGLEHDRPLHDLGATIRDRCPGVRIVVLIQAATPLSIARAETATAHGIVTLADGGRALCRVVDAVGHGATVAPPAPQAPDRGLSPRERQVLQGLDEGVTYQEIANRLGMSLSTAKTHSRSLFRKLDVTSRGAAVHRARAEGLLPMRPDAGRR